MTVLLLVCVRLPLCGLKGGCGESRADPLLAASALAFVADLSRTRPRVLFRFVSANFGVKLLLFFHRKLGGGGVRNEGSSIGAGLIQ